MTPAPAADGAAAAGNTNGKPTAAPEPVHRTRGTVQGKRERASKEESVAVASPAELEGEMVMERTKLARSLERTSQSLKRKLHALDTSVTEQEEDYIATTWSSGNIMRGWDPLVPKRDRSGSNKNNTGNGSGSATGAPKHRKPRHTDRIFSLSSSTSQLRRDGVDPKKIADRKKKKKR